MGGRLLFKIVHILGEYEEFYEYSVDKLGITSGLTKTALADFAALQRFYLLNIEKKTNRPTANALFFICDALSIRPSDFFRLVEQKMEALKKEQD